MPTQNQTYLQVFRKIGAIGLCLNDYNGGVMPPDKDLIAFYSNIVVTDGPTIGTVAPPLPSWRPVPGTSALIGYAKNTHPNGLPATIEEISPNYMSWNPSPGTSGIWGSPGGIHYMNSIMAYCGVQFDQDEEKLIDYGSGHAAYSVGAPYSYDLKTHSYSWDHIPVPEDQAYTCAINFAQADVAAIATYYPSGPYDTAYAEVIGESTAISALYRQPGKRFPLVGHTAFSLVLVPAYASATKRGTLLPLTRPAGRCNSTDMTSHHKYLRDQAEWRRTHNTMPTNVANGGGACFFGGTVGKVFSWARSSSGAQAIIDVYDPILDRYTPRTAGGSVFPITMDLGGGVIPHLDTGLFIVVVPTNSSDVITYVNATKQRFFAAPAATVAAGSTFVWTELTVSASSWPVTVDTAPYARANGWTYADRDGVCYAINGLHGSTTLWKLHKPTSGDPLTGTWTIDTETFTGTTLQNYDQIGNVSNVTQIYNRLFYMKKAGCLAYRNTWIESRIQAITPAAW
jgi:hypothetical protein